MLLPARTLVSSTGSSDSMTSRDPDSMDKSDSLASVNSVDDIGIAIAETQATRIPPIYCMQPKESSTQWTLRPGVFHIVAILLLPGSLIGRDCLRVGSTGWTLIATNDVSDLRSDRPPASKIATGAPEGLSCDVPSMR